MREISVSLSVTDPPQEVYDYLTRLFGEVMRAGYQVTLSAVPVEYEDEEPPLRDPRTVELPRPPLPDETPTEEMPTP